MVWRAGVSLNPSGLWPGASSDVARSPCGLFGAGLKAYVMGQKCLSLDKIWVVDKKCQSSYYFETFRLAQVGARLTQNCLGAGVTLAAGKGLTHTLASGPAPRSAAPRAGAAPNFVTRSPQKAGALVLSPKPKPSRVNLSVQTLHNLHQHSGDVRWRAHVGERGWDEV